MTAPVQPESDVARQEVPPAAVTAAAERIVDRRMRLAHWHAAGLEAHRAALMIEALPDATAALEAATPVIRAEAEAEFAEWIGSPGAVTSTLDAIRGRVAGIVVQALADERDRIRRLPLLQALSDPGSILPRLPHESVSFWQLRAVLDLIGGDQP